MFVANGKINLAACASRVFCTGVDFSSPAATFSGAVDGATVRFESTYRQAGHFIFLTSKATRNRPKAWCSPDMWEESESLSSAISRDARGQVRLR